MDIFLSWSGERSKGVAQALKDWLPTVLSEGTAPWFSDRDLPAGTRWAAEIGRRLEKTHYGIICLTPENLTAPWLLFEAGAVSKALDHARVCPYLLDCDFADLDDPLAQFQGKRTDRNSTFEMLQSLNASAPQHVAGPVLVERFEAMWPRFEARLERIPEPPEKPTKPARSDRDILEDIVETVRGLDRKLPDLGAGRSVTVIDREIVAWDGEPPVAALWTRVISELKRKKQALTAAVYGEARVVDFDAGILTLVFPGEQGFYVNMAKNSKHADVLADAFEAVVGERLHVVEVGEQEGP